MKHFGGQPGQRNQSRACMRNCGVHVDGGQAAVNVRPLRRALRPRRADACSSGQESLLVGGMGAHNKS